MFLPKKKSKSITEGIRFIYTPHNKLVIKSKLLDVKINLIQKLQLSIPHSRIFDL